MHTPPHSIPFSGARWAVHALIVATVLITACGWVGGNTPAPTPVPTAGSSPGAATPAPIGNPVLPPPSIAAPSPSPSPSPSPAASGETYTIAEGDTLATVADRFYGDAALWRRIYDANRAAIGDNPDTVRVGTTLRIPPRP